MKKPTAAGTPPDATQLARARAFRAMHEPPALVLPNAWDAASARLIEAVGAEAIATTSAGIAWSLGYPDGEHLPRAAAIEALKRIVAAVQVPVSADIEGGYADDLEELAATVRAVIGAGAVGINIGDRGSDGLRSIAEQGQRIAQIRRTANEIRIPLFINARTDTFLASVGTDLDARIGETVRRAEAYARAGADGLFVPGVIDPATVQHLADRVSVPLDIQVNAAAPRVAGLVDCGVRRISLGAGLAQAAASLIAHAAEEVLMEGTYGLLRDAMPVSDLNALSQPPSVNADSRSSIRALTAISRVSRGPQPGAP